MPTNHDEIGVTTNNPVTMCLLSSMSASHSPAPWSSHCSPPRGQSANAASWLSPLSLSLSRPDTALCSALTICPPERGRERFMLISQFPDNRYESSYRTVGADRPPLPVPNQSFDEAFCDNPITANVPSTTVVLRPSTASFRTAASLLPRQAVRRPVYRQDSWRFPLKSKRYDQPATYGRSISDHLR